MAVHGLDDLQLTVLDIGEVDFGILMGLDFKFLDGFIHQPVFILKAAILVTGFLGIVDTGVHVVAGSAVLIGNHGADLLGTGFICIDGNVPALQGFTGVGGLMEPAQTLFPVVPGIFHGFTGLDGYIMEHNIDVPVIIAVGQLLYKVAPGSQLLRDGVAGFVGGVFADHFVVAVCYSEHPAAQLIAGVGGFGELDSAILGIGIADFCTGTGSDGDLLFHIGIVFPVGFIPVMDFPDIVFSGCQLTGVGIAVCIGLDGVHQIFVGIEDLEAPALGAAIDSRFGDSEITVVGIAETDGRCLIHSNLNGFHRGIADPVGIADSNFLGIVSAGNQIADCYRAVSTGGEGRTGNSLGAGRICVDSDLPAGQVGTGVGGLDQLQTSLMQVVHEADRNSAACCKGNLLGIGTCTGVQRTDCTVSVTDFLDVVGAGKQAGDGNLTTVVGGVRTGYQGCAGRVRIDTELPSLQILTILRGFGQGQTAGVQLIGEAY